MANIISPDKLSDSEATKLAKSQGYNTIVAISRGDFGTKITAFQDKKYTTRPEKVVYLF